MDLLAVRDLGHLEGEIVAFGGVHSNLQALEALIFEVGNRSAICTGDVVAYCGDPASSVARLRQTDWPVVAGNCERQVAYGEADCGCGFAPGSACDRLSAPWFAHVAASVGEDERAWMAALPDIVTFRAHGLRWAVIHGGATTINRFLWPVSPEAEFAEEVAAISDFVGSVDAVVSGHCGFAFERRVAGVLWVNAGAIGLPPNDGRSATRYAVIGPDAVRIHELRYDARSARAAMEAAGLVQGYNETLTSGWWPSEDILPEALRRAWQAGDDLRQAP